MGKKSSKVYSEFDYTDKWVAQGGFRTLFHLPDGRFIEQTKLTPGVWRYDGGKISVFGPPPDDNDAEDYQRNLSLEEARQWFKNYGIPTPDSLSVVKGAATVEQLRDAIHAVLRAFGHSDRTKFEDAASELRAATLAAYRACPDVVSVDVAEQIEADLHDLGRAVDGDELKQSLRRLDDWQERLRRKVRYKAAPPVGLEAVSKVAASTTETGGPKGPADQPETSDVLKPCETKAYSLFQYAEDQTERRLQDRKAYDWLNENGWPDDLFPGASDYELPTFGTWAKHVRVARNAHGTSKRRRRIPSMTTRSIVRQRDLDSPRDD